MEISFEVMLELVNGYCNQNYAPENVPAGLAYIINRMIEYQKESQYSNIKSETVEDWSKTVDDKDMLQTFSRMLSPYKRLKTL